LDAKEKKLERVGTPSWQRFSRGIRSAAAQTTKYDLRCFLIGSNESKFFIYWDEVGLKESEEPGHE
jgi:hypothetical protein